MSNEFKLVPVELLKSALGAVEYLALRGDDIGTSNVPVADALRELLVAAPQPPVLGGEPDSLVREVFLRNGFTIKEGQQDLKPYVYAAAKDLTAPLQAEIERLAYELNCAKGLANLTKGNLVETKQERDQLKARCDEMEGLLRESVGMVRGTVGNQDEELAGRIEAALSKPDGSERVCHLCRGEGRVSGPAPDEGGGKNCGLCDGTGMEVQS